MSEQRSLHHWLTAGLGSGWLPKAPGTWGSLAALLPAWFIVEQWGGLPLLIGSLFVLLLGCWSCSIVLPTMSEKDPGWIVIDEWAGQWICYGLIVLQFGNDPLLLLVSFIAFRGFDILKPWPISRVETMGPAWWSIMADDIVAGLMGAAVVITTGMAFGV